MYTVVNLEQQHFHYEFPNYKSLHANTCTFQFVEHFTRHYKFPLDLKLLSETLLSTDRITSTAHITTQCEEIDKDELLLKTIKHQAKSNAQQI